MRSCDRCGKGLQVGMNVSHSHIRTKRRSMPNLHTLRVREGETTVQKTFCTKCQRIVKEEQKKLREVLSKRAKTPTVKVKKEAKEPPKVEKKPTKKEKEEKPARNASQSDAGGETIDISKDLLTAK